MICGFYVSAFVGSFILIIYISYFSRCVLVVLTVAFGFGFISRTFDLKMKNPSNAFVRENLLKAVTLSNTSYVVLLFKTNQVCALVVISNGLFPPTETEMETDPHTDSCTMLVFALVWRWIPIPLLKYSKIGMEISPWDGDPSLKWVQ